MNHTFCVGHIKNKEKTRKTEQNNKQKFTSEISISMDELKK